MWVCQRLKRVIVTPAVYLRFLNFFTLTSHAKHLYKAGISVMSRVGCVVVRITSAVSRAGGRKTRAKPGLRFLVSSKAGSLFLIFMFLTYLVFCLSVFSCQYQCNQLPGSFHSRDDQAVDYTRTDKKLLGGRPGNTAGPILKTSQPTRGIITPILL